MIALDSFFFHLGDKKRRLLVELDRRSSYTGTIGWEYAWADSWSCGLKTSGRLIEVVG